MANVFGILTAIVLALSAFIAFKNHAAYEKDLAETSSKKAELVKSQDRLARDEKELAQLPIDRAEVDGEVDKLTADETAQKKINDGLDEQVKTKTDKINADKEQLDTIRAKIEKTGPINELATKMKQYSSQIEELKQSIAASESQRDNLTSQIAASEAQITSTKSKFDDFSGGRSLPTLNTRIRSIYPNWGFVTLAAGNNAGVVASSTLDVVRGNSVIAKLIVTAVESTTASASIIPDSMADDTTLMAGDRVVPGVKETTTAPVAN